MKLVIFDNKIFATYEDNQDLTGLYPEMQICTVAGTHWRLGDEFVVTPEIEKANRKAEILKELDMLDLKSIRALRANEAERLAEFEIQAQALRDELSQLLNPINTENTEQEEINELE
jgi:hypothetical protein